MNYNIEFDEEDHIYKVDGIVKPSVTQTLRGAGIVDDYSNLDPYYADRGTAAHTGCTLLAQGFLDWATVSDDVRPYVETFESIVKRMGMTYVSAEEPCYDKEYDICGTYDLIMMWNGARTLTELKTGAFPMWGGLQLASYERMVDVENVLGIELKGSGKAYIKADDFLSNYLVLDDIFNGTFDLDKWKSNRSRRHMKVLK